MTSTTSMTTTTSVAEQTTTATSTDVPITTMMFVGEDERGDEDSRNRSGESKSDDSS